MIVSNITSQITTTPVVTYAPDSLNPRILVVDDNCEIHSDFRKILLPSNEKKIDAEFAAIEAMFNDAPKQSLPEPRYATVDSANQGERAIELVSQSLKDGLPYSLAFIDVRMPPGLDGIETTRRIWELDPEIQVVICSAYSDYSWHEIVEKLDDSNRFLILKKPFDNIEVRQISSVLHSRWVESRSDFLTGVLNRRAFLGHLTRQRKLAIESGNPLSCVMVDLDYFKRINDVFGHAAGDSFLVAVANELCQLCGKSDLICRYGGEEFCILLKGKTEAEALDWAEMARAKLNQLIVDTGDAKIGVSASFGIASLQNETKHDNSLFLNAADQALFAAKESGRNCCVTFSGIDQCESNPPSVLSLFKEVTAKQIMKPIFSVNDSDSLRDATISLSRDTTSVIPVVGKEGGIVGVLSQQDLLLSLSANGSDEMTIKEIMQANSVCYSEDASLLDIYDFLTRASISQVIISKDDKPSGTISRSTILEWLQGRIQN